MLKLDLKHNVLRPFFLSVILLALVPLLAGTANLDQNSSAVPLEMFVALLGIVMLTPVFQPEQDREKGRRQNNVKGDLYNGKHGESGWPEFFAP